MYNTQLAEESTEEQEVELTPVQKKINKAREKTGTVKIIDKLEKEIGKLEKNIANKRAKIEELAEQL